MSDRSGKRMVVYGKSGSGKTHLVKNKFLGICDRVVIFDPEEDYVDEKGFQTVETLAGLLEILQDCWDSPFKVAFIPDSGMEEKQLHEVSCLIERLQEPYKRGENERKILLVVDELNLSFPLNYRPELSGFARLCSRGRKRGINIIGITQRPAEVATRLRGNIDRLIAFNFSLPNDLKVIRETCGLDAETAVQQLQEFQYMAFENNGFEVRGP